MSIIINPTVDANKIVFAEFSGNERFANAIKPIINVSDPIRVVSEVAIFYAYTSNIVIKCFIKFFRI